MAQIAHFAGTLREGATVCFNAHDLAVTNTLALVSAQFFYPVCI